MVRINSQGVMTVETRIENAALFIKLFISNRAGQKLRPEKSSAKIYHSVRISFATPCFSGNYFFLLFVFIIVSIIVFSVRVKT